MQADPEKPLDALVAFAARVLPRCPPGIDPHHFGSHLSACQYEGIAREVRGIAGDAEVLDWGAGFGHVSFLLASLGCRVQAFDVTRAFWDVDGMLLRSPGVTFATAPPGSPLPYEDARFRTVISVGTLEHCDDEEQALEELRRVTSPGGRLLVYHLPNRFSWVERVARHAGRFYHERTYRPRAVRALLARHGFRTDAVRPYHVLPRSSFSRLPALRGLARRHFGALDRLDGALSRVPPLSLVATALTVHATRGA